MCHWVVDSGRLENVGMSGPRWNVLYPIIKHIDAFSCLNLSTLLSFFLSFFLSFVLLSNIYVIHTLNRFGIGICRVPLSLSLN